jgi:putative intracellular protease/amidase
VRVPLFRDPKGFARPHHGPLLGRQLIAIAAPTECDARDLLKLNRALKSLGVRLAVTSECHGEVRGRDRTILFPDCLLVEVRVQDWDGVVFAGGAGASRVAADQLAREIAKWFVDERKIVAALGTGRQIVAAAQVRGLTADDPAELADMLAVELGAPRRAPAGSALART